MLANGRLRVPPFRYRHIQPRLVEAFAIEIEICLENRRDLSAGSVKIQDDMRQSRVGVHVRNLLVDPDNDPIAKQRQGQSRPAQHGSETAAPSRGNCALKTSDAHLRKSVSRMCFAVRRLSAAMVSVGLAVAPVGNVLLPTT